MKLEIEVIEKIFENKEEGYLTVEQAKAIRTYFNIRHLKISELRELRNFVVTSLMEDQEDIKIERKYIDYMSAITAVIDNEIWELGGAV